MMKICRRCKQEKPSKEYTITNELRGPKGNKKKVRCVRATCKSCEKDRRDERRRIYVKNDQGMYVRIIKLPHQDIVDTLMEIGFDRNAVKRPRSQLCKDLGITGIKLNSELISLHNELYELILHSDIVSLLQLVIEGTNIHRPIRGIFNGKEDNTEELQGSETEDTVQQSVEE